MNSRRQFLKAALILSATYPLPLRAEDGAKKKILVGIITDIHKDIMPDADQRLRTFVTAMNDQRVDAIVEMGDFCQPKPANRAFANIFNTFPGPNYHVLGNHDMDGGFNRAQVVAFHRMPGRYYSFDLGSYHFIVLDGNDSPEGWKEGYPHYLAEDQVAWLKEDLTKTTLNTFVLSHQSLERPACIDNQEEVRAIFESEKMPDGKRKVAACLNGHWHIDHERIINGIPYIHVNSASYYWLGDKYKHERLDPELGKRFPYVAYTAPYLKPVFTILEIDPVAGTFVMRGMKSEWMGPSPQELGYKSNDVENEWLKPSIGEVKGEIS